MTSKESNTDPYTQPHWEQEEHTEEQTNWSQVYNNLNKTDKLLFWIHAILLGPILLFNPLGDNTRTDWLWAVGTSLLYIGAVGLLVMVDWIGILSAIGILGVLSRVESALIHTINWLVTVFSDPLLYVVVLIVGLSLLAPFVYKLSSNNND